MLVDLTPLLRAWEKLSQPKSRATAINDQGRLLQALVRKASCTRFGIDHGFNRIRNLQDFVDQVPIVKYDSLWERYWSPYFPHLLDCTWPGQIRLFAETSGTSSARKKLLPITAELQSSIRKAAFEHLLHHVRARPKSRILGGPHLMLGSSAVLTKRGNAEVGDLSGILIKKNSRYLSSYCIPSRTTAHIDDWHTRLERIVQESCKADVRSISGIVPWLMMYFNKLFQGARSVYGKIEAIFPNLELISHGGVSLAPHQEQFDSLLSGSGAEMRETYIASEGYFASADRGPGEGLLLHTSNGIFYEFIPLTELGKENPQRHWVGSIIKDVDYALAVSTCAGLWGCLVGDVVRFIDTSPPRLLVTGRTSYELKSFGEALFLPDIEGALLKATAASLTEISGYCVGPVIPRAPGAIGGHLWLFEFVGEDPNEEQIAKMLHIIDEYLQQCDYEYARRRDRSIGILPPRALLLRPGTLASWCIKRGSGGQAKIPTMINDPSRFLELVAFAESHGARAV